MSDFTRISNTIVGELSPDSNPYIGLEDGTAKFTDEPLKAGFLVLEDMAKNKVFQKDAAGTSYDASLALFAQGKSAMVATGTWSLGGIKDQNPEIRQGVIIQPAPGVESVYQFIPAQAFCINPHSDKIAAALKFVEFLSSKEAAEIYSLETLQNVTIKGVEVDQPELAEVNNVLENVKGIPSINMVEKYPETYLFYVEAAISIISGRSSVDEAIAKAQAGLDELIESKK